MRRVTAIPPRRGRATASVLSALAADWLDAAIPSLTGPAGQTDEVIHNFRTATKRARALVRLFGQALEKPARRREDARLREAARALAGPRDAAVARALLLKLRGKHRGRTAAALTSVLRGLAAHAPAAPTPAQTRAALAHAHATLHATVHRLRRLRLTPRAASGMIEDGLRASYRRSRHLMKRALTTGAAAHHHEWRQQTKRLFYQLQFPGLADSKNARRLVRQLDGLQERLGAAHDTQLVMDLLRAAPARLSGTAQAACVMALLEKRGAKLRTRCGRLGAAILSGRPAEFARRIGRWLARLAPPPGPACECQFPAPADAGLNSRRETESSAHGELAEGTGGRVLRGSPQPRKI